MGGPGPVKMKDSTAPRSRSCLSRYLLSKWCCCCGIPLEGLSVRSMLACMSAFGGIVHGMVLAMVLSGVTLPINGNEITACPYTGILSLFMPTYKNTITVYVHIRASPGKTTTTSTEITQWRMWSTPFGPSCAVRVVSSPHHPCEYPCQAGSVP